MQLLRPLKTQLGRLSSFEARTRGRSQAHNGLASFVAKHLATPPEFPPRHVLRDMTTNQENVRHIC